MYDAEGEISVDRAINSLPQLREPQVSLSSARKLRSQNSVLLSAQKLPSTIVM